MITIGNIDISDVSVGSAQVLEIWVGTQLVWPITVAEYDSMYLTDEFGNVLSGMDPTDKDNELWLATDAGESYGWEPSSKRYKIITNKCVSCGSCETFCPVDAISNQPYTIDPDICVGCGLCKRVCPVDDAIIEYEPEQKPDTKGSFDSSFSNDFNV